jgi:cobalt/nickel transport system permease protein
MHIPDGVLTLPVAGASAALSLTGVGAALHRLKAGVPRRTIPLMGLAGAFIFAAQMLNFPVGAGTSGHLVGGTLAAVLLGPSAAVVVMTAVVVVQSLLLADGGLLAIGANVLNMALVSVLGGYAVYRAMTVVVPGRRGVLVGAAFASWCSTVLAASACGAELAVSGVAPASTVVPAMATVHVAIGIGEALITLLVLSAVSQTRPELIPGLRSQDLDRPVHVVLGVGLAISIALTVFVAPLASLLPDGLERVMQMVGASAGGVPEYTSPPAHPGPLALAHYELHLWVLWPVVGTLVVFALAWGVASLVQPRTGRGAAGGNGR